MDNAHQFLLEQLGSAFLPSQSGTKPDDRDTCECCERPQARWSEQKAYKYRCVYSNGELSHCPSCRIFSVQSKDALGLERTAGSTPVYLKLSSFKGGFLVLEEGVRPQLWVGGKYPEKISREVFDVVPVAGGAAMCELLDRRFTGKALIVELSLRRERFMKVLKLSTPGNLMICSAEGTSHVTQQGWEQFKAVMASMKGKDKISALNTLRAFSRGEVSPSSTRAQELWQKHPDLAAACKWLPTDPHGRLFWLSAGAAA